MWRRDGSYPWSLSPIRYFGGCAGLQLEFPAQQIHEVGALWVPFEESIAVGW